MNMDLFFAMEILGTIAFAFSGAMTAIEKKMDIFGVAILGMTTSVGGGIIRDLILGNTPPAAFRRPVYALTGIAVSLILFIPAVRKLMDKSEGFGDMLMLLMDTIGLGVFTVAGVETALETQPGCGAFLAIFVGVLTGVGGGVLKDLFAGLTPSIFVKHFYATASLIGAIAYMLFWRMMGASAAMIVCVSIVVVLRLLAAIYHWNLPVAK